MKKLTLDQTWKLCLSMWRWIVRQIRQNSALNVNVLKQQWLDEHGYDSADIRDDCFFCAYIEVRNSKGCEKCPGKKVDKGFDCRNFKYSWFSVPIAFYNKLVSLNRKRMKKKRSA